MESGFTHIIQIKAIIMIAEDITRRAVSEGPRMRCVLMDTLTNGELKLGCEQDEDDCEDYSSQN